MQGRIKQMINGKDQEIITINKIGNSILNNAKYSADNTDEWYTTYETIAEELSHYKNQFIDKVVLCNCDDPFESNFCYYFLRHFNQLKLKKLICTSYSGSKIDQLVNGQLTLDLLDADGNPVINNKHGYVLTITQIPGEHSLKVFPEIACPMVKPPVGIKVCPVVNTDLFDGSFINSMFPQHFFLGFFPDTPLPVLTSVVICHSFFLQSI